MKQSTYKAQDGDIVRSRAELVIDNFLFNNDIKHVYEKKVKIKGWELTPDWYLPDYDLYIEFWGMEENKKYSDKQRKKLKLYAESGLRFLSLNDVHIENGPLMRKTILDFIESAKQEQLKLEKVRSEEEKEKQREIDTIKAKAEEKVKTAEDKAQARIRELEEQVTELEKHEELSKFMGDAITWTVNGIQTTFQNIIKQKKHKPPRDRNCIYCKKKLVLSRHICTFCVPKIIGKGMCVFCGAKTTRSKICNYCASNAHTYCRLCRAKINPPQKGKPVCDVCILKIPQIFKK